jgi:hypothetical protein
MPSTATTKPKRLVTPTNSTDPTSAIVSQGLPGDVSPDNGEHDADMGEVTPL